MAVDARALTYLSELQHHYITTGGVTLLGSKYQPKIQLWPQEMVVNELLERGWNYFSKEKWQEMKQYVEAKKAEFTSHETFFNISMLSHILDDIKRTFQFSRLPFPQNVAVGTTQFGGINAFASAPSRNAEYKAILLDDGLFTFINSFSKIISLLLPKQKEGNNLYSFSLKENDLRSVLNMEQSVHDHFVNLITSYLITDMQQIQKGLL